MKNKLDILSSIAKGPSDPEPPRADDTVDKQSIEDSTKWITDNKDLDPEVKAREFLNYTKDKPRGYLYKEWHWETYKGLHPQGPDQAVTDSLARANKAISSLATHQDREHWWTDNISKLPREMTKLLEPVYLNSRSRGDLRDIERGRLFQYSSVQNEIREKSYEGLDTGQSPRILAEQFLKGFGIGTIDVDENGFLSIMVDGQSTPISALPDTPQTPEEAFIAENDLKPELEKKFTRVLAKGRAKENQAEREMLLVAYNRIDQDTIPSFAKANIIIDYNTMTNPSDVNLTMDAMSRIMKKDISDNTRSSIEITNSYLALAKDILKKAEGRVI